jgi:hypothetical protein
MESTKPGSATFLATVAVRIVDSGGVMCANFAAGESREIPAILFDAALLAGLIPESAVEAPPVNAPPPPQEVTVADGLKAAVKTLIIRAEPNDFTVVGNPRAASVKKLVDFEFTAKDIEKAFSEAMHEVEQDGNDSPEHSESSSESAE